MAIRTEESRTDSLTCSFRPALSEELFEDVAVRRVRRLYLFARCLQNGPDLFAATLRLCRLLCLGGLERRPQNETVHGTMFPLRSLRDEFVLFWSGTNT